MQLQVDLLLASDSADLPGQEAIERWVGAALAAGDPGRDSAEVSVCLVDEAQSRELNHQYRGRDKPTNVLSFPADLPEGVDLPLLGDLVVCAPVVRREALEQGKTAEAHWAHMLVHGSLHLLGYDHTEETEAEIMERLETDILTRLNYPPPYDESPAASQG